MTHDAKIALAVLAAGVGIVGASRIRNDLTSQVVLFAGFGLAQWLVQAVHDQRYPEVPAARLQRALRG